MSDKDNNINIAVLANEVKNLAKEIAEMKTSLNDLRIAFPTRSEFDIVKTALMGTSNDGGLVNRVDRLEKRFIYYMGSGVMIVIMIIAAWQLALAYYSNHSSSVTNINTTSK